MEVDVNRVARALALTVLLLSLIGCQSRKQAVVEYLGAAAPLLTEWVDGHLQATLTDRASLSPVIDDLQIIRSRYDALDVPRPCRQMHENVPGSMDYSIDGFTAKLAGEDDEAVTSLFAMADAKLSSALKDLAELRGEYGD